MSELMQMKLVRQQCDCSCGIACAAMVAGVPFHVALERYGGNIRTGMSSREMGTLLRALKVRYERRMFAELTKTLPHIVVVPSLNVVGGNHYVVLHFDGRWNVLDPQRGRHGKKYYALNYDDPTGEQLLGYSEIIRIWSPGFAETEPLAVGCSGLELSKGVR